MNLLMRKGMVIFLSVCFFCAKGQEPDSLTHATALSPDTLVNIYYARLDSLALYNGRQFYRYADFIEGDAYFPTQDWTKGSILYDGAWYRNISILYDAYKDGVIVRHPEGMPLQLFRERVQEFIINGQTFVYLSRDEQNVISSGIYQLLVSGKITVYAKRVKLLDEKINGLQLERKFLPADRFYILKDNKYYAVKKQKQLLALLKDKSKEMSQYKRQLNLRFKTDAEQLITAMAKYYNELR